MRVAITPAPTRPTDEESPGLRGPPGPVIELANVAPLTLQLFPWYLISDARSILGLRNGAGTNRWRFSPVLSFVHAKLHQRHERWHSHGKESDELQRGEGICCDISNSEK